MNTVTIYQLILAKQSLSTNRLWKDVGLTLAILILFLVVAQLIDPIIDNQQYAGFAIGMFIIAVLEMGGHSFSEFKKEKVAYQWLTLPATVTDKWLSNFLTSLVIVPIIFLLVLVAATLLTNLFLFVTGWSQLLPVFNPLSETGWFLLRVYLTVHPLMFFAAIYFNKRPILKAFAALSILMLIFLVYLGFLVDLLFSGLEYSFPSVFDDWAENSVLTIGALVRITEEGLEFSSNGAFKYLINIVTLSYFIFFWGLSYLRLKEMEL